MFKSTNAIQTAAEKLQAAFTSEDGTAVKEAFDAFGAAIAESVRADFIEANGDNNALLQRGFRVLTSAEKKYFEGLIEMGKNPRQAYTGIANVMPETVIEDVYEGLVEDHPLLAAVNFVNVNYLTRWIMNDHTADAAVWGDADGEISKAIVSAFKTVELTQGKLSAYAVIEKAYLELGPVWLDNYVRTFLKEALATGLEAGTVSGIGIGGKPIGLDRDIHDGVTVSTTDGYPQKTAVKLKSFMPEDYGAVLATLAVTEGGKARSFDEVTLICNQADYLTKIMPAATVLTANGQYAQNVFPFPTEVIRSSAVTTGKAILCLPGEYFLGVGIDKEGTIEFSDDAQFLADKRVFKAKLYGAGRAYDNTCAVLLDISELEPAYIYIKDMNPAEAAGETTGEG